MIKFYWITGCVHGNHQYITILVCLINIYHSRYNIIYLCKVLCDSSLPSNALGILLYLETGGFIVDEWYGDLGWLNRPMYSAWGEGVEEIRADW